MADFQVQPTHRAKVAMIAADKQGKLSLKFSNQPLVFARRPLGT